MTLAGVRPGMLVHNANTYGLFTGGHGFHQGAERIGAPVVPVSGGFTARQALLLHDFGAQVLVSTPSYAIVLAQAVREAGFEPADLKLELGLFGGEPWTEGLRGEIERALPGLQAVNFYGLSEMCGPGVAAECLEVRDGLHVHEDHFLVEVVDPESGAPLDEDVEGELVFTTLRKEAMPLLRYRTGDIGSVTFEACRCGRTTARIRGLRGRRDDMLIVRGVNVYPSNVEHALLSVPEAAPHYQLVVERDGAMDELTVQCEPAEPGVDGARLHAAVERVLHDRLGIRVRAEVLEPGAVPRSEGKAVRVVDRRGRRPS
jgi:phenylacetate-CoA ligase